MQPFCKERFLVSLVQAEITCQSQHPDVVDEYSDETR